MSMRGMQPDQGYWPTPFAVIVLRLYEAGLAPGLPEDAAGRLARNGVIYTYEQADATARRYLHGRRMGERGL